LIGQHTVNTVPQKTYDAFRNHGIAESTIENDLENAKKVFPQLAEMGISIDTVTNELEEEGVKAFADSFTSLLKSIERRLKS
jgi:transaldolase